MDKQLLSITVFKLIGLDLSDIALVCKATYNFNRCLTNENRIYWFGEYGRTNGAKFIEGRQ